LNRGLGENGNECRHAVFENWQGSQCGCSCVREGTSVNGASHIGAWGPDCIGPVHPMGKMASSFILRERGHQCGGLREEGLKVTLFCKDHLDCWVKKSWEPRRQS
jgi:hypothetical protein